MDHPGPPRFCAVGETVELAPRDPDPAASYEWRLLDRPDGSDRSPPGTPVWQLDPDVPGTYRFELRTPDDRFEQCVRAVPDPRRSVTFELDRDALPDHDPADVSVLGPFNDHLVGRDRPTLDGDTYVYEVDLPPGSHRHGFVVGEDLENAVWDEVTVPGPGRPRVRLAGERDGDEVVVTADATPGTDSAYAAADLDVAFLVDDRDPLADADLVVDGREARVPLDGLDESVRIHAVAVGERRSVADCLTVDPDGGVDRANDPPAWARDAVVYEIFVRSFTDAGTVAALERRLPYLEHLGVDCVWLTPILESPTDHGYHTTDYFDVASDLGTREEFASFVDRCHDAGIRVVFDLVINHTAREHAAFDLSAAGVPAYDDWYVWDPLDESSVDPAALADGREGGGPPTRTREDGRVEVARYYFNWRGIPNVDYDSLAVRSFFLSVVDEWADVVDGFRCDVAWGVPHGFWKEVHDRVKLDRPEFLLLDETIPRDPAYAECEFDVHYDTTLYGALRDVGDGERPAADLLDAATAPDREGFPDWSLHMRYVENHDEPRYLDECDAAAQRAAVAAVLTLPGVPMIYYGQERGATDYRGPMPWEGDAASTAFHRRLIAARRDSRALSRGDLVRIDHETDADGAVAFVREADDETVVVALNFGEEPARVRVPHALSSTDRVSGEPIDAERAGEVTVVTVDDVVVATVANDR